MRMNKKERAAYESALSDLEQLSEWYDAEAAHMRADETIGDLLTALRLDDVTEAYKRVQKRCA